MNGSENKTNTVAQRSKAAFRLARGALYFFIASCFLAFVSSVFHLVWYNRLLDQGTEVLLIEGDFVATDFVAFLALPYFIAYIACLICMILWIVASRRDLANYETPQAHPALRFRPRAWFWYFIPIANLFVPYQLMKETWQAAEQRQDFTSVMRPAILPLWWTTWLIGSMFGRVGTRLTFRNFEWDQTVLKDEILIEWLALFEIAFLLVAAICLVKIISGITTNLNAQAQRHALA